MTPPILLGCVDYALAFVIYFYNGYITLQHGLSITQLLWIHGITGVYAKGDFMVHLAGLDDKKKWMQSVLKDTSSLIPDTQPPARPVMSSRKESLPLLIQ